MAMDRVSDTWESGSPYERYVGRWSRQVAPLFLEWLNIPPRKRWLDVGCGTGALVGSIADRCSPSSVCGVEPSEGFLAAARRNVPDRVALLWGSATAIPLDDASVDVVVSALVLNFVSDSQAALREMARVTTEGGTLAAYVWDYAGRMELMRLFWDAAVELNPDAAPLDEGVRFPICRPEPLRKLFAEEGFQDVDITPIDIPTSFANFDDYWQPFLGGQGPGPSYVLSLEDSARARLRDRVRERISTTATGAIQLTARAWAVRATVPGPSPSNPPTAHS